MTRRPAQGDPPSVIRKDMRSPLAPTAALALALASSLSAGCSGPPIATTFKDEPICSDFSLGAAGTKMRGGLRQPVRVSVLDGKDAIARTFFYGKRAESDPSPRLMIPDGNATYTIEWAQCENERASVPLTGGKEKSREGTSFECGKHEVYKTETITVKKGDPSTHTLVVPAPPKAECWKDERPAEEPKQEAADAGAPEDAGAADAGATTQGPEDAGAVDASDDAATKPVDGVKEEGGAKKADAKGETKPDAKTDAKTEKKPETSPPIKAPLPVQ